LILIRLYLKVGCSFVYQDLALKVNTKNNNEQTRNTIFTTLAKGGVPSGQICPSKTMRFRMIKTVKTPFFMN